jgi:membrane protease YdiL (CAAX protease family)
MKPLYNDLSWLNWRESDLVSVLPILLTSIGFILFWFTSKSDKIKAHFYNKYDYDTASVKHIFFTKYFGFIAMGVLPTIFCLIFLPSYNLADYGLTFISSTSLFSLYWILGLSALVIPLAYISAKKPKNLINYPQIRAKIWTRKTVTVHAFGWFIYLFGYEFMFRGILLFPLVDAIGVWPAIAVNIALYSATHIPKGLDETIGAIPLGLVLCILTLASGTIWIALFVHVAMAWTNCFTALKYHPDIHYQPKR